ncbi:DUF4124 domain-containing protein [Noviherbaspirillum sp.]|uniref:DUF4124 domain-containing protein n=1 Tax=Noviherbaspirillum sp. TaxID=1926288 RepID=UPI002D4C5684|nr:DUF4124 domain-containing protein [Noviherbaspirillum sp.]HZW22611.1 DUF4124 domain-containing protein [Noviherbaspirillum sp.]
MKRAPLQNLLAQAALAILIMPATAAAQYVWLDERGTKQFSDMPPPASVPSGRILKQPGARVQQEQQQDVTEQQASAPARAEPTLAEKNAEFRKRRQEQADKEKKAAEEATRVAENARNCERAREYQRTLDSGQRIVRTDSNGERSFLSDEQRAQESAATRRALAGCK